MTMVYATPDQLEALTMGERVGVIRDGKVVAIGTPRDLYAKPGDTYVAQMVGSPPINLLPGRATAPGSVALSFLDQPVSAAGVEAGQDLTLAIRPHDIVLGADAGSDAIRFAAKIHLTEPLGDVTVIDVVAREATLKMVLREEVAARLTVGQDLEIAFNPADVHLFDGTSGARLEA
jgi:multiple sugar transport system ATP-binding protein